MWFSPRHSMLQTHTGRYGLQLGGHPHQSQRLQDQPKCTHQGAQTEMSFLAQTVTTTHTARMQNINPVKPWGHLSMRPLLLYVSESEGCQ